jgi:syntaxin 1A/syntaxin 1B/2/3
MQLKRKLKRWCKEKEARCSLPKYNTFDQIVNTAQRVEAKRALQDIQQKHLEVVKIEKSILELQHLFIDMSVLLAAQGEMVDQIALHVTSAVTDTEKGVQALNKAVKMQRKSRKVYYILN